jgi:histidinol-phosphate aminotransferase
MSLIKQRVRELPRYEVPQDGDVVKLNQNEFPHDLPEPIKGEILARLAETPWQRYPDGQALGLMAAVAAYAGVPQECVLLGNASNELIQTVIAATCDSGDYIVTVTPGFAVYGRVAATLGVGVREVPLRADFSFDAEAMVAAASGARVVIFASPNNPTGTWLPVAEIEELVARVDCLVCVDEAYFEFHGETALPLMRNYGNLVLLRTFSKALRLAGIRLGYLLGPPQVVAEMAKARLPFSVGILQQIAGEVVLAHRQLLDQEIREVVQQREELVAALQGVAGVEAIRSRANFVLFRHQQVPASDLFAALRRRGVLVRAFGGVLSDWLRVTVGTGRETKAFLQALSAALTERL